MMLLLDRNRISHATMLAIFAFAVSACAPAPVRQSVPAQIEIQEAVGFTITEESRVGDDVRLEYDEALVYLERGELDRGIELLEEVTLAAPDLTAPHVDLGVALHRADDLESAERVLLQALEMSPDHPVARNELGIIYRRTGRFAEARQSYEDALAVYPGYHFARRNLAVLCDLYLADLECAKSNYEAYMATVTSDDEVSMWMKDLEYRMAAEN